MLKHAQRMYRVCVCVCVCSFGDEFGVFAGVEELEMMGECCGVLVKGVSARDSEEANFKRAVSCCEMSS